MHGFCCVWFGYFFLSSLIVGGVYEAVCQKTIDSREPAYTKRVCRPSEAVEPWKLPPFAFAQVKPKLCGYLVQSAGICKEVKHIHATVHSALRTVSRSPAPKIPARRGDVHTLVQLVYLTGHKDTPVNTQGVPSIRGASPGRQRLWQRQCGPAAHTECIGKTHSNGCVTR